MMMENLKNIVSRSFKHLLHIIQFLIALLFLIIFRSIPYQHASALGGKIAEYIGPLLAANRVARINLSYAMPDLNQSEKNKIIKEMWNNIGRGIGEFAHINKIPKNKLLHYVTIKDGKHITNAKNKGGVFITAHYGNWEYASVMSYYLGVPLSIMYREDNNKYVASLIKWLRSSYVLDALAKSRSNLQNIIQLLKNGHAIAMLPDHRLSTGIKVPFFGHEAHTTSLPASLNLKFKSPLIMARMTRVKNSAFFTFEVLPPIKYKSTGNRGTDLYNITSMINSQLEQWIRERPDQWFWLHRRWDRKLYKRDN